MERERKEKDRERERREDKGEKERERLVERERERDRERSELGEGREGKEKKDKEKVSKISIKDTLSTPDYFISGLLTINDRFQHSFFDVKVRKQPIKSTGESAKKSFTVKLFTSDIPPVPCDASTKFHVEFTLEKVKSDDDDDTTRILLAEATFEGSLFSLTDGTVKKSNNFVTVSHNLADWHFMEQGSEKKEKEKDKDKDKGDGPLIVYFLSARVPHSKVKKLGHLL